MREPRGSAADSQASRALDDWFLTAGERGNPATEIDRRRGDGTAWTEGNRVEVLVDGAEYFRRLLPRAVPARAGRLGPPHRLGG